MICDGELIGNICLIVVKQTFHRDWILDLIYGLPYKNIKKIETAKFQCKKFDQMPKICFEWGLS
jgi:hypothetical protein